MRKKNQEGKVKMRLLKRKRKRGERKIERKIQKQIQKGSEAQKQQ